MSIAARNAILAGGGLSAKSYVQDGLIAMWDGIENAGWGESDNQNRLVDLTGNQSSLTTSERSGTSFKCRQIISAATLADIFSNGNFTYEVTSKTGFQSLSGWNYMVSTNYRSTAQFAFALRSVGSGVINTAEYSVDINNIGKHHIFARVVDGYLWIGNESGEAKGRAFVTVSESSANFGINALAGFGTNLGYNGYEDAIRIYSRALTAAEVAANYAVDKARFNLA